MNTLLVQGATIVNEGQSFKGSVFVQDGKIEQIINEGEPLPQASQVINGTGKFLIPGVIDDQVHFREPGLTHKADITTESIAAVAGGITSFMEMPNTVPNTLTQELLEEKYAVASSVSPANYSFFMGASNDNLDEVLKTNPKNVCGVKVFMGSSTGNMLVDNRQVLEAIFSECPMLIATHCEDEATIRANIELYRNQYGEDLPINYHPEIRSTEACYRSSSTAVELAAKHNARLHVLHISTAKEVGLFENDKPLNEKRITAEACVHHLTFTDADYDRKGTLIKWNPAVKSKMDREAIWSGLLEDRIDVLATDHAPHTLQEKQRSYFNAPSGGPLVQHFLPVMVEHHLDGRITMERLVEKMCHAPAICFEIERRGFIRKGYWADLVLIDTHASWKVETDNILYKCKWSPFEGETLRTSVTHTIVNGNLVYENGTMLDAPRGQRLTFDR